MYLKIAMFAYFVVLFLTLRDVRIFKRTGYRSYRRGALKGLAASTMILIGAIIVGTNINHKLRTILDLLIDKKVTKMIEFSSFKPIRMY